MARFDRLRIVLAVLQLACVRGVALPRSAARHLRRPRSCRFPRRCGGGQSRPSTAPAGRGEVAPGNAAAAGAARPCISSFRRLEAGDLRFPINLATALRLADARPLIVAAAQASAWVAEAQLQQAKLLWVPDFNLGFDYIRHDGFGPDTIRGVNIPVGSKCLWATHARQLWQTAQPKHQLFLRRRRLLLDAIRHRHIFEPLAARQVSMPALGHPDRQERRLAHDRPRLLRRPQISRPVRRRP